MDLTLTTKFFVALFAIMNPMTTMPVYLALAGDIDPSQRRSVVWGMIITVSVGALVTALVGHWLLSVFGIDVNHFTLAGGLIVLAIAWSMLNGEEHSSNHGSQKEKQAYRPNSTIGVYPLGIPLSMGPGAMATILIFEQSAVASQHLIGYYIGLVAYLIFFSAVMLCAPRIGHFLSGSALSITKRIMGIILAAIAMEMVCGALAKIFPAWVA